MAHLYMICLSNMWIFQKFRDLRVSMLWSTIIQYHPPHMNNRGRDGPTAARTRQKQARPRTGWSGLEAFGWVRAMDLWWIYAGIHQWWLTCMLGAVSMVLCSFCFRAMLHHVVQIWVITYNYCQIKAMWVWSNIFWNLGTIEPCCEYGLIKNAWDRVYNRVNQAIRLLWIGSAE